MKEKKGYKTISISEIEAARRRGERERVYIVEICMHFMGLQLH